MAGGVEVAGHRFSAALERVVAGQGGERPNLRGTFRVLYADGVIKRDVVVKELIQRGVFQTGEQVKDFLAEEEDSPDAADLMQPVDPSGPLAELEKLAAAGRAV